MVQQVIFVSQFVVECAQGTRDQGLQSRQQQKASSSETGFKQNNSFRLIQREGTKNPQRCWAAGRPAIAARTTKFGQFYIVLFLLCACFASLSRLLFCWGGRNIPACDL